jgi:hypothetical protein
MYYSKRILNRLNLLKKINNYSIDLFYVINFICLIHLLCRKNKPNLYKIYNYYTLKYTPKIDLFYFY